MTAYAFTTGQTVRHSTRLRRDWHDGRAAAGRDLACWCPLDAEWCHADDLLALANGDDSGDDS